VIGKFFFKNPLSPFNDYLIFSMTYPTSSRSEQPSQDNAQLHKPKISAAALARQVETMNHQVDQVWRSSSGMMRSLNLFHYIGYGLLTLFLLNLATILYPLQLMNPEWEFGIMGQLVDRAPIALIALALIFAGEKTQRTRWERPLVRLLSWLTLIISVAYFLMIPLLVVDGIRIARQNRTQVEEQLTEITGEISTVQQRLEQANTQEQLQTLFTQLQSEQGITPTNVQDLETARQELSTELANSDRELRTQAQDTLQSLSQQLIRNAAKWIVGALIIGTLFLTLWRCTRWARLQW
jgi:hypothetical protein